MSHKHSVFYMTGSYVNENIASFIHMLLITYITRYSCYWTSFKMMDISHVVSL